MAQQGDLYLEGVLYLDSDEENMQRGLKEEEISQIPTTTQIPEGERCCICLVDFEAKESARQLVCKHLFHNDCLLKWLEQNVTCPLCRQRLTARPEWDYFDYELELLDNTIDLYVERILGRESAGSHASSFSDHSDIQSAATRPISQVNQQAADSRSFEVPDDLFTGDWSPRPWDDISDRPFAQVSPEELASLQQSSGNFDSHFYNFYTNRDESSSMQVESVMNDTVADDLEIAEMLVDESQIHEGIEHPNFEIQPFDQQPPYMEVDDQLVHEEMYNENDSYVEEEWLEESQVEEEYESYQSSIYNPELIPTNLPPWLPQGLPRHSTWLEPAGNGLYWRVDVDMHANVFLNVQQNAELFPVESDQVYYH